MRYNYTEVKIITMYSIGEFGKQIGVTPKMLRNWNEKRN